jgi:ABC-type lipoprotein export system ATPase subunit
MGDEPTGNLDKKNSDIVFGIFKDLASENNKPYWLLHMILILQTDRPHHRDE